MPYFCHQCQRTVQANQHFQCSRCNGEFIEEIEGYEPPAAETIQVGNPMQFLQALMGGAQFQPQQQQQEEGANPSAQQPSGSGILQNILSGIFSATQPSSSNASQPAGGAQAGGQQQQPQQTGDPFTDFLQMLMTNLSANAPQGTRVHINIHGGQPTIHGNINNYVFGEGNFDQLITQFLNGFEQQQQGLTEDDLARLPMVKVNEEQVANGLQCTTCMDDFQLNQEVAQLNCKHVFHEDCIAPWLRRANTCPICRTAIDPSGWKSTGKKPKQQDISDVDELD